MKTLLLNFWKFLLKGNNLIITIIILLFLGMGLTIFFQNLKIDTLTNKYETEVKIKNAMLDSNNHYINKNKELVTEKLSLQATISYLDKMNFQLSTSQKELLERVKEINKTNSIIAAALIETNLKIDSLLHKGDVVIDTINKKITFPDSLKNVKNETILKYNFVVGNVLPAFPNIKPTLLIKDLYFPNKQFVEFHWKDDNNKVGSPVTFSVSNSNDYFKTVNIDSYTIPEINKNIDPTKWQKFEKWFVKNGRTIIYVGIGGAAMYLLMK